MTVARAQPPAASRALGARVAAPLAGAPSPPASPPAGTAADSHVARTAVATRAALLVMSLGVALAGCGPAGISLRAESVPVAPSARDAAVLALGRTVFAAVQAGEVERVLFDDLDLRALLDGAGASRAAAVRHTAGPALRAGAGALSLAAAGARYVGVCLQESSVARGGGALGLRREAWVVGRVLVVAEHPRAGRVAGWAEGVFVHSSRGFGAVTLDRIEPLRPAHSDLELAVCDMAAGLDEPGVR